MAEAVHHLRAAGAVQEAEAEGAAVHQIHQGVEEEEAAGERHLCRRWGEEEEVVVVEERPRGPSFVRVAGAAA